MIRFGGEYEPRLLDGGISLWFDRSVAASDIIVSAKASDGKIHKFDSSIAIHHTGVTNLFFPIDLNSKTEENNLAFEFHYKGEYLGEYVAKRDISGYSAGILPTRDYVLRWWVSRSSLSLDTCIEVEVDGYILHDAMVRTLCHPVLQEISPRGLIDTYELDIPTSMFDGNLHKVRLYCGGCVLIDTEWSARPEYYIELFDGKNIGMWFYDASNSDCPTTISVWSGNKQCISGRTTERRDVFEVKGMLHTGFAGTIDATDIADSTVQINVGRKKQLSLASIHVDFWLERLNNKRRFLQTLKRFGIAEPHEARVFLEEFGTLRANADLDPKHRIVDLVNSKFNRGVTVIIPIYSGFEYTVSCLESLKCDLALSDSCIREIILVNDCSPDFKIRELVEDFDVDSEKVHLLKIDNERNLGFVGSVNKAISVSDGRNDVILLNADTEVSTNFACKLMHAAYSDFSIATVTPISNNASICSFPAINAATNIRASDFQHLSKLAHYSFLDHSVEIPVANGFCMYIKRAAIQEVGLLDESWGKGYCEEVDWCLRARDRGWRHVCSPNTFILHEGSVSFGANERLEILERNHRLLEDKFPDYVPELRKFVAADPAADTRVHLFLEWIAREKQRIILHLCHQLGGGTEKFVKDLATLSREDGWANLICFERKNDWLGVSEAVMRWEEKDAELTIPLSSISAHLVDWHNDDRLTLKFIVHSLIGNNAISYKLLEFSDIDYEVVIHDFQWFCPRVNLVDQTNLYCGEPEIRYCQLCVRSNSIYDFSRNNELIRSNLPAWLDMNEKLLRGASRVVCPSQDTYLRLTDRFKLDSAVVVPHPEGHSNCRILEKKQSFYMKIAVVGSISVVKGQDVLISLCEYIKIHNYPVRVVVVGSVTDQSRFSNFDFVTITGQYQQAELANYLGVIDPDFVFFPAVWPETYSYVLSEVFRAGYPAVSFDIGAIAERIKATGGGAIIPFEVRPEDLYRNLLDARKTCDELGNHIFDFTTSYVGFEGWLQFSGA